MIQTYRGINRPEQKKHGGKANTQKHEEGNIKEKTGTKTQATCSSLYLLIFEGFTRFTWGPADL